VLAWVVKWRNRLVGGSHQTQFAVGLATPQGVAKGAADWDGQRADARLIGPVRFAYLIEEIELRRRLPAFDLAVTEWCKRRDVGVVLADPVFGTIGAGIDNEGIASAAAVGDIRVVVDLGGWAGAAGEGWGEVGWR